MNYLGMFHYVLSLVFFWQCQIVKIHNLLYDVCRLADIFMK